MTWRRQPPAYSPVDPRSLVAGAGAWLTHASPAEERISADLSQRYAATAALLADSGTSALVMVLRHVVGYGRTVAYPAYGCIDLTAAAVRAGVRVRLYDLDPNTLSPDLESVKKAVMRGVEAIVVAHLYGYPADVAAVRELADQHGIPVIEDAAQAAGGTLLDKRCGALADLSILSFGRGKGITAGSGGAVLARTTPHAQWIQRARERLGAGSRGGREIFTLAAQWMLARPSLYRIPAALPALRLGEMVYRPAREPRSISAAAAAILPAALEIEEGDVAARRARAAEIIAAIGSSRRVLPIRPLPGARPGYLRLAFLDSVGDISTNPSLGVLRGYPMTLDQHEQLQPALAARERAGKGAEFLRDRLLTAAVHSRVSQADIARFGDWIYAGSGHARVEEAWAT